MRTKCGGLFPAPTTPLHSPCAVYYFHTLPDRHVNIIWYDLFILKQICIINKVFPIVWKDIARFGAASSPYFLSFEELYFHTLRCSYAPEPRLLSDWSILYCNATLGARPVSDSTDAVSIQPMAEPVGVPVIGEFIGIQTETKLNDIQLSMHSLYLSLFHESTRGTSLFF